ncbi:MAG: hypothetical protein J5544_00530 [Clostridia bacterium]|nr:hypothetical protein [Clostridia bacterium]
MENRRTTRTGRRNRRRLNIRRVILVILALFVIAGGAAAAVIGLRGCSTAASKRSLPFPADSAYCYTGDGFLYLRDNTLNFYSLEDEKNNSTIEIGAAASGVIGTDKIKAVYANSSIQVIDTPFDNAIDGLILKLRCGNKYIGAYVKNTDETHSLRVFNSTGTECYREDFSDKVLLDFGFEGGDSAVLYMTELVVKGSALSTTITTYDLNRSSKTGVISVQGQIVKQLFMTKKSIFAFGTDSIVRYDRATNEEVYRLRCRGYECIGFSAQKNAVCLLLTRSGSENSPLSVLTLKEGALPEESVISVTDTKENLGCFLLGGKCVLVKADRIVIYNQKGAVEKTIAIEDGAATGAEKLDEKNIIVFRGGETVLYTVK